MAAADGAGTLLAQWEAEVAAASTSAQLRACLDVDRAAALKADGLDRARVVELLSAKREEDVERWADGVAPAFGAFLNKLKSLPDPALVAGGGAGANDRAGTDGKGGAGGNGDGGGNNGKGPAGSLRSLSSRIGAPAAAVGNALARNANAGGGNDDGVPLEALRRFYQSTRNNQMVFSVGMSVFYCFLGLIQAGIAMFSNNMYGYSSSACECVMVNAYMGVFEGVLCNAFCGLMGSMLFFGPKAGAWGEEPDEGQAAPNANNTLRTVYRKPVLTHLFFLGCTLLYTVLFGTLIGVLAHFLSFYIFYGLFFVVIMLGFCRIPCDDTLVLETGGWGADVVDVFFSEGTNVWDTPFDTGAFGLGPDFFGYWPAGYLVKHLQLVVIMAAIIQLFTHAYTLYKTLKMKEQHEGRARLQARVQGQPMPQAVAPALAV